MSKTIKQLADQLGCSKTAIRKKMDSIPGFRDNYTETTANGFIVISPDGCKLIAETIGNYRKPIAETSENVVSDVLTIPREVWEALQKQLEEQSKTIEAQRKQISDYNERLKDSAQALLNEQDMVGRAQALHAGTIKQLGASGQKKGLFGGLFKKKGKESDESEEMVD